ncbi:hypothetical protein HMPREF0494_0712 [Limosilactobacillus antri DSM 16041]|uniref:Uncharacterized protein n=1 Tax=Limosilactobacillus antri DSM 16041 TaxID=525309 RepID=C8P5W8_9LACO|nr:hypothetical protein HMPREF0494_0712 [Limosilactobacillus antri DSM 16041]
MPVPSRRNEGENALNQPATTQCGNHSGEIVIASGAGTLKTPAAN